MRKLLIILNIAWLFVTQAVYAHEDRHYTESYNNVTMRFKTGYYNQEVENAKIIAQYAAMLCDSLDYEESVVLDFIHDYTKIYDGEKYQFISYGKESFVYESYWYEDTSSLLSGRTLIPVNYTDTKKVDKTIIKKTIESPSIDGKNKLVIRQFGFHFEIRETLNMLYYALSNSKSIRRQTEIDTLESYMINMYYLIPSIPSKNVEGVLKQNIPLVQNTLTNKVYASNDSIDYSSVYYSYYSVNGRYHIFYGLHGKEIEMDTVSEITYLKEELDILMVLFGNHDLRFYSESPFPIDEYRYSRSKKHQIPNNLIDAFYSITLDWLLDDVYLINFISFNYFTSNLRLVYLKDDDVLITDFDYFLNSYRRN